MQRSRQLSVTAGGCDVTHSDGFQILSIVTSSALLAGSPGDFLATGAGMMRPPSQLPYAEREQIVKLLAHPQICDGNVGAIQSHGIKPFSESPQPLHRPVVAEWGEQLWSARRRCELDVSSIVRQ